MASVAIVTDSTHYLPAEMAASEGIHQVSLYVGWQGAPERELEMPGFDAFYARLREEEELPFTSQPSIGDFLAVWEPLLEDGSDIVPVERVRTAGRAFERMVDYAHELRERGSDGWVVQHIQAPEQAERLIERCREIFDSDPVFTSEIGPVIGTYTGPGLIGIGGVPRSLLS